MSLSAVNKVLSLPDEVTGSKIFQSALTHRSAGKDNNERLEFLGDAVLGLVIANILFEKFPSIGPYTCSNNGNSRGFPCLQIIPCY